MQEGEFRNSLVFRDQGLVLNDNLGHLEWGLWLELKPSDAMHAAGATSCRSCAAVLPTEQNAQILPVGSESEPVECKIQILG